MMTLKGGPAAGSYAVKRAPLYLRGTRTASGVTDVLDQVDDAPARLESVYVYRRVGEVGQVHINRGRHGSGFFVMAEYEYMPEVDGEALRDNAAWRAWCQAQPE